MALFTLVTHGATGSAGTLGSLNTTGANLIIVNTAYDSGATISDNKGNTWTPLTSQTGSGGFGKLYFCAFPTVGSGHSFTLSIGYGAIFVQAWTATFPSSIDQQTGAGGTAASLQPGSMTPSANNELIVFGATYAGTSSGGSIDSGFTISDDVAGIAGTTYGGGMAYLIQTAASAVNPTYSVSAGASKITCTVEMVSFTPLLPSGTFSAPVIVRQGVNRSNTF